MGRAKNSGTLTTIKFGICALLASSAVVGCISGRSDIDYGSKGPAVGYKTLKQIKPNITTKEWVLAALGEPSCESGTAEGTEILKYEYVKKIDSCFSISPFLALHDKKTEHKNIYFEVKDGIVTKLWKD